MIILISIGISSILQRHNFQELYNIKSSWYIHPDRYRVAVHSSFYLKPLTAIICRRTGDSVLALPRWISRQVLVTALYISPLLTLPSLAHHFSVTSQKGWCLSLWGCLFRCGLPGQCGMPGGLPMRLDGDSDMVAWPNDLQNRKRGAGKKSHWLRPCLLSWAALLHSCLFLVKSTACLF